MPRPWPDIWVSGVCVCSTTPRWAEPLREELRTHAERLAAEACLEIEFIRHYKAFRKEERVKAILAARGEHPGLVHIFSAMEACILLTL